MDEQPSARRTPRGFVLTVALGVVTLVSATITLVAFMPSSNPLGGSSAALAACTQTNAEECIPTAALAIAELDGPADGLRAVRVLLETRPELAQGCHDVAHQLGKGFRDAFGDDAVVPGNEWCSYGYYHGLMQAVGEANPAGLVAYAGKLCSQIENTPTPDCMHGLGHAAYTSLGSIAEAMSVCEEVRGNFARTCADAVLMEDVFSGENGRMASKMEPGDCLTYRNIDVRAGCAAAMSGEMSRQGSDLGGSCSMFSEPGVYSSCAYGYGSSVVGNFLSGNEGGTARQIASCATNEECSKGFGWISYMYQLDRAKAEKTCRDVLGGGGVDACLFSLREAVAHEKLGRS